MIITTHALAAWLRSHNIDPSEVTLVLRAKTTRTEFKLAKALGATMAQQVCNNDGLFVLMARAKLNGIDILVTSLDTSARRIEQ